MSGDTLLVALRRTTKPVKVIDHGRVTAELTPAQALELVTGRTHWHGCGTKRKISAIEFRPPLPQRSVWQECWRTVEAAVLPPSIDWLLSRRAA
jgi:hypothetical protein